MRDKLGKKTIVLLVAAALVLIPLGTALAQSSLDSNQPDAGAMATDLILVRPLGFVSMILGTAAFIVSIPFTTTGKNVDQAWDTLVAKPATFTFQRPLGNF